MDDPDSVWEIQESSGGNSDNGKLSWMLRLGRKILVTGIVISSAPLVLPPLMAISAITFVCSVPYGIFLVSYACTETVMSRLLPMPSPAAPLLLECRKASTGEEEANGDEDEEGQNEVIKGGISIEREEEELKDNTIEEVEMRIELDEKKQEEFDKRNILQEGAYQKGGVKNDEKKSMEELIESMEENGYEGDGGEFLGEEEKIKSEQSAEEGHGVEAVVEEDEKHRSSIKKEMPLEAENVKSKKELVIETEQSVENIDARRKPTKVTELKIEGTSKGKGEQSIKESVNEQSGDEIHVSWITIEDDEKERDNVNRQTTVELKNVAHVENQELVSESKEQEQEQHLIEESLGELPVNEVSSVLGSLEGSEKDSKLEETPLEVKNVPIQIIQAIDDQENEKLLIEARCLSERIRDERKTDCEVDDEQRAERVNVAGVQKQPKEIEVKIAGTTELDTDVNSFEESQPASNHSVYQEISDSSELPVSTNAQESDDIATSAENASDTASNEAFYSDEEKIWEQINTLRAIVGYKEAGQETCIEELKALYIFTGIEPPAGSFKDTCDLVEVNAKLRFLMSVVGVK